MGGGVSVIISLPAASYSNSMADYTPKHEILEGVNKALGAAKWETQQVKLENERIKKEKEKIEMEFKMAMEKWKIEEEYRKLEVLAREIEENAKKRVEEEVYLRKQAEENLANGVPEVKYPSPEQIKAVRKKHDYLEGNLHFAITGASGSGKSSLINAFRGHKNSHKKAAKSGTTETTGEITRYDDPKKDSMYWYDVPGAGTPKVPDWQYFNDQGLYIFDIIIIVIDIRFTKIDLSLLLNCKRFGITTFVVRSKANQHIYNTMEDDDGNDNESSDGDDDGDDDGHEKEYKKDDISNGNSLQQRYERAREKFITGTRLEFNSMLKIAELPPQKIYIVSKDALYNIIKGPEPPADIIDEVELVKDIYSAVDENCKKNQTH